MKKCRVCDKDETQAQFKTNTLCINCHKDYMKEYRLKNREKLRQQIQGWKDQNRDKVKDQNKARYATTEGKLKHVARINRTYRSWLSHCLSAIKSGANRPGAHSTKDEIRRQFDIDLDYVDQITKNQSFKCAITGIEMTHQMNDMRAASIDRIDCKLGHVRGNIQIVCQAVNYAKRHYDDRIAREFFAQLMHGRPSLVEFDFDDVELRIIGPEVYSDFYAYYHYMGRTNRKGFTLGAYLDGILIGAGTLSSITRKETATRLGYEAEEMKELSRFCIHPSYHRKNFGSWLLSRIVTIIEDEMLDILAVVSFADTTVGHDGTLYGAANWKFDGLTAKSYHYEDPSGQPWHKKTIYDAAIREGMVERQFIESRGLKKVPHLPKRRYLLEFKRPGRRILPLEIALKRIYREDEIDQVLNKYIRIRKLEDEKGI